MINFAESLVNSGGFKRKYKALILGAGYRGRAYAEYAEIHPDELEIVGVADPVQAKTIQAPRYWTDWRECLAERPEADIVMVTMPDDLHFEPSMAALDARLRRAHGPA